MTKTLFAKNPTHHRCPGDTPVVHLTDFNVETQARALAEAVAAERLAELGRLRVKAAVALQIIEDLAAVKVSEYHEAFDLIQRARQCLNYGEPES